MAAAPPANLDNEVIAMNRLLHEIKLNLNWIDGDHSTYNNTELVPHYPGGAPAHQLDTGASTAGNLNTLRDDIIGVLSQPNILPQIDGMVNAIQGQVTALGTADRDLHDAMQTIIDQAQAAAADGHSQQVDADNMRNNLITLMLRLSELQARIIVQTCPAHPPPPACPDMVPTFDALIGAINGKIEALNAVHAARVANPTLLGGGAVDPYEYKYQKYKAKYNQLKRR